MVALAPRRSTYALIKSSGLATVNVLGWDMLERLHYLGTVSLSRDPDKMARSGLRVSVVDGYPKIEGALAVLYCRLRTALSMGDHDAVFLDVVGIEVRGGFEPRPKVSEYKYVFHVGGGEYTTNADRSVIL